MRVEIGDILGFRNVFQRRKAKLGWDTNGICTEYPRKTTG